MSAALELQGLRALVTGGTKGVGKAVVAHLCEAGANVLATARSVPIPFRRKVHRCGPSPRRQAKGRLRGTLGIVIRASGTGDMVQASSSTFRRHVPNASILSLHRVDHKSIQCAPSSS